MQNRLNATTAPGLSYTLTSTMPFAKPFKCDLCSATFKKCSQLKQHRQRHSGKKPHTCADCAAKFATASGLSAHRRRTHASTRPLFQCAKCGKRLLSKIALADHLISLHPNPLLHQVFQCEFCFTRCASEHRLLDHRNEHRRRFVCAQCGTKLSVKSGLLNQLNSAHPLAHPFGCAVCLRMFASKFLLRLHFHVHTGQKKHRCRLCEQTFRSKVQLDCHRRHHGGKTPFGCAICGYECSSKKYLEGHIYETHYPMVNIGYRRFKCDACGKRFLRSAPNHKYRCKAVPKKRKPFVCIVCGISFKQVCNLRAHQRSVHTVGAFGCSVCERVFQCSRARATHERTHGPPKFSCGKCSVSFHSLARAKLHEETMHPRLRAVIFIRCARCQAKCKNKLQLERHLRRNCKPPRLQVKVYRPMKKQQPLKAEV